jgi:ketosteroid isomerase-like protein
MSQEDVEIVRQFFDAFLDGPRALERVAHEDVVYVEDPKWPGADTYEGRDAVIECWSRYDELLGEGAAAYVKDIRDAGEEVVAIVRVAGRTRDTGIPYDHTWGYTCRTTDGAVSYFRAWFSPAEALEAFGLSE